MSRLTRHLTRGATVALATLVAVVPTATVDAAQAATEDPAVVFYTPLGSQTAPVPAAHLLLGTRADVRAVQLQYRVTDGEGWTNLGDPLTPSASGVIDTTWTGPVTGQAVDLQALASDGSSVGLGADVVDDVTFSPGAGTAFSFVRPAKGEPLGVYRRADGRAFARASGFTTRNEPPAADAPAIGAVAVPASRLPAPTGTLRSEPDGLTYRVPVDLSGNPGLPTPGTAGHAVIRVHDSVSSAAVETSLYYQRVKSVTSSRTPVPGTADTKITAKVLDQNNQVVVGAPVHLRGYVNGSRTPVSQVAITDAHDGLAIFTVSAAGFYVPYVDTNLNGYQTTGERAGSQVVVGTVTRAAPGRALYHNNAHTRGAGGTVGDSLRGTRAAAARRYQWIDQDGQLSFGSRAALRSGVRRVSHPTHLTWVNAHGSPFNPRWMRKGRFETRAWSSIRRRPGLRNADMTFAQNAAYHLSVEWEVKDIKPFTSAAALNAAFASLAASARRYYGAAWQSRVQVKMLSDLSGGPTFALRVLRYAHAHGFTTIYLARKRATGIQIPASAHAYVTYVRGAKAGLYPSS